MGGMRRMMMSDGHLDTFLLHETANGVLVLGRAVNLL